MTLVITVEDGSGRAGANAYLSVYEADTILESNVHAESWFAATDDTKARLLVWASRYLDDRVTWRGRKAVQKSGLRWPRAGVVDRDGFAVPSNEVPTQLKVAVAEMARALLAEDRSTDNDRDGLARLKADSIELGFVPGYRAPKIPEAVIAALRSINQSRGRVVA